MAHSISRWMGEADRAAGSKRCAYPRLGLEAVLFAGRLYVVAAWLLLYEWRQAPKMLHSNRQVDDWATTASSALVVMEDDEPYATASWLTAGYNEAKAIPCACVQSSCLLALMTTLVENVW